MMTKIKHKASSNLIGQDMSESKPVERLSLQSSDGGSQGNRNFSIKITE